MDAVAILTQAKGLGLTLSVVDGQLNITGPKTPAAATLVTSMALCKAELIAALTIAPPQRPPLPAPLWVTGIASLPEARRLQLEFAKDYVTHLGKGQAGYYVAGPDSGLCVHNPPLVIRAADVAAVAGPAYRAALVEQYGL